MSTSPKVKLSLVTVPVTVAPDIVIPPPTLIVPPRFEPNWVRLTKKTPAIPGVELVQVPIQMP